MDGTNYISLGKDRKITWKDFGEIPDGKIFYIDHLLNGTEAFWNGLETECLVACCGIDAYGFWPEDIQRVKATIDAVQVSEILARALSEIEMSDKEFVGAERLNNYLYKDVFIALLDHLIEELR